MNKFFEDVMNLLKEAASQYGSIRKLADAAKMNPSTVSKWLADDTAKNKRSPNIREVGQIMDLLKARVVLQKNICQSFEKTEEDSLLMIEIDSLKREIQLLQVNLEKERAVSARLQEIMQTAISSQGQNSNTQKFPLNGDKAKTA